MSIKIYVKYVKNNRDFHTTKLNLPTSALDVTVQAQVVKQMMDLRDKMGTAIVIVTHNMGVASKMADYIAVMQNGELKEFGTREQVIYHPENDYTKKLLTVVPKLQGEADGE